MESRSLYSLSPCSSAKFKDQPPQFSSLEKEASQKNSGIDNATAVPKVLKYEMNGPTAATSELPSTVEIPELSHEFWNNAKKQYWEKAHQQRRKIDEPADNSPRSEISSVGSSDSGESFCLPGQRGSISCGLVRLREHPRPFSKAFVYSTCELKVTRAKLYIIPIHSNIERQKKVKVRPTRVFRLSNIEKVEVRKKDQGYSTISLTLSPHCEHKKVVLAVDTTISEDALEWVDSLNAAVASEQIRATHVKQEFRELLQKQKVRRESREILPIM
jgi:hypothetical protein